MKLNKWSVYDIKYHFRNYKAIYFLFLLCVIVGIVCGTIIIFSSENYLGLLTSKNKSLYPYINGTVNYVSNFWKQLVFFLCPMILIFVANLNYYLGFISYLFITYQSALLVLSCAAVIKTYSVSGFFNVLFIILPTNIVYFAILMFFSVTCMVRSKQAQKTKMFKYGFEDSFYMKVVFTFLAVLILSVIVCFVYPLFLKSSIFIIF